MSNFPDMKQVRAIVKIETRSFNERGVTVCDFGGSWEFTTESDIDELETTVRKMFIDAMKSAVGGEPRCGSENAMWPSGGWAERRVWCQGRVGHKYHALIRIRTYPYESEGEALKNCHWHILSTYLGSEETDVLMGEMK